MVSGTRGRERERERQRERQRGRGRKKTKSEVKKVCRLEARAVLECPGH